jgi:peptidoglycan/xylan/chitin deacetylase (PgdA/CDA1 family)
MKFLFPLFLTFVLFGCNPDDETPIEVKNGAIIISFDDKYVSEWVEHRNLFIEFDIKATFFVCRPHLLTEIEILGLQTLENDGHEIGCHSLNHLNALDFDDNPNSYIDTEIAPALNLLTEYGFNITSFAFPYGKSTPEIDTAVSEYFTFVRKATYNYKDTTLDYYNEIFANQNNYNLVNAMGIDMGYDITLENIENGILRAKENNEVLILFAHQIIEESYNSHIEPNYLRNIFELCQQYEIKSIRMKDLWDYYNLK